MRSIGLLAVVTGTLGLVSACSDGGGGGTPPPDNQPPVAGFSEVCTHLTCVFTDASTDPDGNADVATRTWFFGDNTPAAEGTSVTHEYPGPNTYTVLLRVTDNGGLNNIASKNVTVAAPPPENEAPVAGFTFVATDNSVAFINTSTDADGTMTYLWNFGEPAFPDNESTLKDPTHVYTVAAPGTFTVTLTVTDDDGATDVETQTVSVAPVVPVNVPPTAAFTYTCSSADCSFISTSSDEAPGSIVTYAWTFGDGGTANVSNPLHSYTVSAPRNFTVKLTVTDNEGATDVETQTVAVTPPPTGVQGCTTSDKQVNCALDIPVQATLKLKLTGIDCDLEGSRITAPPPVGDQIFLRVCWRTVGEELGIFGGPTDSLIVYQAGTQAWIRFTQGSANKDFPVLGIPAGRLDGAFPFWTLSFEDGDNPAGVGEPDFTDVVLEVRATERP